MTNKKPGEFPYKRGIYPNMYKDRLWTTRQYAGFTSADDSNKRFLELLDNGVKGLSVAFDLPSQIGYDSDHVLAIGEVGKVGVPICTLDNMENLFKDIPLHKISTSMTINATAAIMLAFYIVTAEKKGINPKNLTGTIQNDILKEYAARGTYIYPPVNSMRLITDIFQFCESHLPNWNTISVSGYHIREAGSTAEQELAFTFANAIAYVNAAIEKGLDPNKFGTRISFFFNAHNGFLEEIAKFRAARKIWAIIMKDRFGVTNEKALLCRFHTQTGGSTLTATQIDNNIVRTTIQALSAILGGTQSLHTNSRDEALSLPTKNAATLALRTQQIIAHETEIPDYVDPFGGSYLIEELTEKMINNVTDLISTIDDLGGAIKAIEQGWIANEIANSAYDYQKQIDSKKKIIVGINKYIEPDEPEIDLMKIDPKKVKAQIRSVKSIKQKRNNDQVKSKLFDLKLVAQSTGNVIPAIIDCVKSECTLGEISDQFRSIFGEHEPH